MLESFSQEELRRFVKFACNQQRIPSGTSANGTNTNIHVPPYPMKLAPPDDVGRRGGHIDQRMIRAETCMFMIKLPQYSTTVGNLLLFTKILLSLISWQEIMKTRLLQAINSREDPLVG